MARKKKPAEHVNHERWMVSYADFMTLLFATFTAMFAISNADKEKFAAMAKSVKSAFTSNGAAVGIHGPNISAEGGSGNGDLVIKIFPDSPSPAAAGQAGKADEKKEDAEETEEPLDGSIFTPKGKEEDLEGGESDNKAKLDPAAQDATATPTPTPTPTPEAEGGTLKAGTEGAGNEAMAAEIQQLISSAGLKEMVDVRQERRGTVISLGEAAFFAAGSVEVYPQSRFQLDKIVNVLRNKNYEIRVEGHTDDSPVTSGRYRDNLELSTLRASRIVQFMIKEYHFPPNALSSAGFGEWRPIASNKSVEGRQKNRRVDIVILNQLAAAADPHPATVK